MDKDKLITIALILLSVVWFVLLLKVMCDFGFC